jgi:hypothetical protein
MSQRKFGPKTTDHPGIGRVCPACRHRFKEGDYTTLVVLGPGDDPDSQLRRDQGRPYNAVASEVHWACSEQLR